MASSVVLDPGQDALAVGILDAFVLKNRKGVEPKKKFLVSWRFAGVLSLKPGISLFAGLAPDGPRLLELVGQRVVCYYR